METNSPEGAVFYQDTVGLVEAEIARLVKSAEFKRATAGVKQDVIKRFAEGPRLTTIPAGETLESLQKTGAIIFSDKDKWIFDPTEQERLNIEPTTARDVIYFPGIIPASYAGAFDKEEVERVNHRFPSEPHILEARLKHHAQAMVDRLPKVPGVKWAIPSFTMLSVILANHQQKTGEYLLPNQFVWTSDTYDSKEYGPSHLLLGYYNKQSVRVSHLVSGFQRGTAAVFVVGLPE